MQDIVAAWVRLRSHRKDTTYTTNNEQCMDLRLQAYLTGSSGQAYGVMQHHVLSRLTSTSTSCQGLNLALWLAELCGIWSVHSHNGALLPLHPVLSNFFPPLSQQLLWTVWKHSHDPLQRDDPVLVKVHPYLVHVSFNRATIHPAVAGLQGQRYPVEGCVRVCVCVCVKKNHNTIQSSQHLWK